MTDRNKAIYEYQPGSYVVVPSVALVRITEPYYVVQSMHQAGYGVEVVTTAGKDITVKRWCHPRSTLKWGTEEEQALTLDDQLGLAFELLDTLLQRVVEYYA